MFGHKKGVAVCLLVLMAVGLAFPVRAQQPQNGQPVAQTAQTAQNAQEADKEGNAQLRTQTSLPPERIGVDSKRTLHLTLRDTIEMALDHNLDIEIERDNVKTAEYNLKAALGVYDFNFAGEFRYTKDFVPQASKVA